MTVIGNFVPDTDGYVGSIRTLTLHANLPPDGLEMLGSQTLDRLRPEIGNEVNMNRGNLHPRAFRGAGHRAYRIKLSNKCSFALFMIFSRLFPRTWRFFEFG